MQGQTNYYSNTCYKNGCTTKEFKDYLNKYKDQAFNNKNEDLQLFCKILKEIVFAKDVCQLVKRLNIGVTVVTVKVQVTKIIRDNYFTTMYNRAALPRCKKLLNPFSKKNCRIITFYC